MINPRYMTLSAVAKRVPGRKGHMSLSGVSRWVSEGILLRNGERIRLQAIRVGQSLFVTEESLTEFLAAMNPKAPVNQTPAALIAELAAHRAERPGFFEEIANLHEEKAELLEHLAAVDRAAGLEVPQ